MTTDYQREYMQKLGKKIVVDYGSDEHLTLIGAPLQWNSLTDVDRADMLAFGRACIEAEREACATIVEKHERGGSYHTRTELARAIRARSIAAHKI
jgi:hypothetical protein